MEIVINGGPRRIDEGMTLAALLEQLEMKPKYVAVERNRELVPRGRHAECVLQSGDLLEIVTLVGGG
ncbi:MAG: sulfur carrier protein ThiS [Planctomycetes bacterium]|nr:sulfur carrier protein ThiS [Planctomycetota bacterium]